MHFLSRLTHKTSSSWFESAPKEHRFQCPTRLSPATTYSRRATGRRNYTTACSRRWAPQKSLQLQEDTFRQIAKMTGSEEAARKALNLGRSSFPKTLTQTASSALGSALPCSTSKWCVTHLSGRGWKRADRNLLKLGDLRPSCFSSVCQVESVFYTQLSNCLICWHWSFKLSNHPWSVYVIWFYSQIPTVKQIVLPPVLITVTCNGYPLLFEQSFPIYHNKYLESWSNFRQFNAGVLPQGSTVGSLLIPLHESDFSTAIRECTVQFPLREMTAAEGR